MSELLEALRTGRPLAAVQPVAPARPVPMADWIIQANTERHTVGGYTSYPMLAGSHEASIRDLVGKLQALAGATARPASGCHMSEQLLGGACVQVEFEAEPASGDGINEPRHELSIAVTRVFLNGYWICAEDCIDAGVIERWEANILADAERAK